MQTLFDLVKNVRLTKESTRIVGDVVVPELWQPADGAHLATPAQVASLWIFTTEYTGHTLTGFQRIFTPLISRVMARGMVAGKLMPTIEVGRDEFGIYLIVDGQHRCIASMMSGIPVWIHVRPMTRAEAIQLFSDQALGRRPSNDNLILSGNSPYHAYIQDALTTEKHAWANIVGPGKVGGPGSTTKITPTQMMGLLYAYVGDQVGMKGNIASATDAVSNRWDQELADELASLISVFGSKQTNPEAFTSAGLKAIGVTATLAIRRRGRRREDIQRWQKHMPSFQFQNRRHLTPLELVDAMVDHWNKKVHIENKVSRPR